MIEVAVASRSVVADGVVALDLAGINLPAWEPGAHIDVEVGAGVLRQYSLCGEVGADRYRIAVLNAPAGRGGSRFMHALRVGDIVRISPPRNNFALVPAERHLFIAGGIGITPLLPMLDRCVDWRLVYGGRSLASMAFARELVERFGDRVVLWPQDELGLLDLDVELGNPTPDTAVYCCGPEGLLGAVEQACASWPTGSLRVERFAPREDSGERSGFEVEVASTGQVLSVPADVSVLEVVEESGIPVVSSCGEGTCGTCETTVLDGVVDHRDSVLSAAEQESGKTMMICVSRGRGRLVLDL
ncbi:ferredoxin-NADP reductase [Actinokineospora auranticolor]|uniref:Ferredoxin-NADP reductase n=1 Tax=Actinokineospora auranticolor TaxID=155976 RepID=A0A2S6GI56_9PSEU|nr:ferredoxin-NADP reductase [Actinokineospora auranticolor]